MSKVSPLQLDADRYDEASVWIARLDRHLSNSEMQALESWVSADSKNKTMLLEMALLWDNMDSLARLSHLFPKATSQRFTWPLAMGGVAIAASVIFVVFVSLWFRPLSNFINSDNFFIAETEHVYQTAIGERSTVTLTDGTSMVLNTDSLVRVDYTSSQRLLTLTRGEIYVTVAKDHTRPLSVLANSTVVQAVGTQFNVEITDDQQIELVVTEGKVRVGVYHPPARQAGGVKIDPLPESSPSVSAGEIMVLGEKETQAVSSVSEEDIRVKLSWQQGNLVFRGESLEEAVKEVGRYTSVEFVILDDALREIRVAGLFKAGDVDSLLAALRENFDIVSQKTDDQKIFLSSE